MEGDECLGCRFSSVKVTINVPDKCNMKRFAQETKRFASHITGKARQKRIHYTLVFDSEHQNDSNLGFNVNCQCILNVQMHNCSNFSGAGKLRIKHLKQKPMEPQPLQVGLTKRTWPI